MQIKGVLLVTGALFLSISALVLHLWALRSPHWKVVKRIRDPIHGPVSYGIWQRCEYTNQSISKQDIVVGIAINVETCRPNRYMRYSPENLNTCYRFRRQCALEGNRQTPEECFCRYSPSAKGLQWLTVLAAICLVSGIPLLYFRVIASPENNAARFVLRSGPFICFLLALLLMITGLILFSAFLRRDVYEDYSFPVPINGSTVVNGSIIANDDLTSQIGFERQSLRIFSKSFKATFNSDHHRHTENLLREHGHTHYQTVIGGATITEIIATVLVLIVTVITLSLAIISRSNDG